MGLFKFFQTVFTFFLGTSNFDYALPLIVILSIFCSAVAVKLIIDVPIVLVKNWKRKLRGEQ